MNHKHAELLTITELEEMLNEFYLSINSWIERGCPTHPVFFKGFGLCSNLNNWVERRFFYGDPNSRVSIKVTAAVLRLMGQRFVDAGLSRFRPFDEDFMRYVAETKSHITFDNRARLAWIRNHI